MSVFNPYGKISEVRAFAIGAAAVFCAATIGYFANALMLSPLKIISGLNVAYPVFLIAQFLTWLVPALIFYALGKLLSPSHIRLVDVFSFTAFAQVPLVFAMAFFLPPCAGEILNPLNILNESYLMQTSAAIGLMLAAASLIPLIFGLVWLFNAVKVSANLKGASLWGTYLTGLIGGDIAVRMLMVSLLSTSFAMSGLAASDANAGSSKDSDAPITGRYEGVIKAPGQTLRYVVIVDYEDGEYFAYSEHPDEGGARLPIDKFSKKGSNVVFSTSKLGISFKGKVNRGATEISGTFSQNGLKIPLKLKKTEMKDEKGFELKGDGPMMSGKYSGDLRFPGQKLRFELYVEKNGDKYDIYTKSPDQGGGKMAVETFRQNGRDVMFAIPDSGVRFAGKADASSDLVSGTFFQYSFKIPLKLKKE